MLDLSGYHSAFIQTASASVSPLACRGIALGNATEATDGDALVGHLVFAVAKGR